MKMRKMKNIALPLANLCGMLRLRLMAVDFRNWNPPDEVLRML